MYMKNFCPGPKNFFLKPIRSIHKMPLPESEIAMARRREAKERENISPVATKNS